MGSSTCGACEANRPFEELLYTRCAALGIPVVYVLPDRKDQEGRVKELRLLKRTVIQVRLSSVGVTRTPTILGTDGRGLIKAVRIGNVVSEDAERALNEITVGVSAPLYRRIERREMERLAGRGESYQLIALSGVHREAPSASGYVVMLPSELSIRARYELRSDLPTFVDCDSVNSQSTCQDALRMLAKQSFASLFAVDLPDRGASPICSQ